MTEPTCTRLVPATSDSTRHFQVCATQATVRIIRAEGDWWLCPTCAEEILTQLAADLGYTLTKLETVSKSDLPSAFIVVVVIGVDHKYDRFFLRSKLSRVEFTARREEVPQPTLRSLTSVRVRVLKDQFKGKAVVCLDRHADDDQYIFTVPSQDLMWDSTDG